MGITPMPPMPPARRGTDGMAIAAFVLSLVSVVLISVILAIVSLGRIRRSGARGRGLAIASLIISGLWVVVIVVGVAVAITAQPDRSPSGQVTQPGRLSVQDVKTGDCIKNFDEGRVARLDAVPCTQPHAAEVIGEFDLPSGSYPGESAITDQAESRCTDMVPSELANSSRTDLGVAYLYPQASNWAVGDRTVQCMVASDGAPLTAPLTR